MDKKKDYQKNTPLTAIDDIIQVLNEESQNGNWTEPYLESMLALKKLEEPLREKKCEDRIKLESLDLIIKNMQSLLFRMKLDSKDSNATILNKYNGFIKCVIDSLQGQSNYHFMLFPGMIEDIGTTEICHVDATDLGIDASERFIIMDLPIDFFAKNDNSVAENLLPVLCHELTHYIGSEYRNRFKRLQHIYRICARIIVLGIKTYLLQIDKGQLITNYHEEAWEKAEKYLIGQIKPYYLRSVNPTYINSVKIYEETENKNEWYKKNLEYNKNNIDHLFFLIPTIINACCDMLEIEGTELFQPVISNCFREDIGYNLREKEINKCISEFLLMTDSQNGIFTLAVSLQEVVYVLKEAYADLISLLELNLSPQKYLHTIVSRFSFSEDEYDNIGIRLCMRILVVIRTMKNNGKWAELDQLNRIPNSPEKKVWNRVKKVAQYYCGEHSYYDECDENETPYRLLYKQVGRILFDNVITTEIMDYLDACAKTFSDKTPNKLEEVRGFIKQE